MKSLPEIKPGRRPTETRLGAGFFVGGYVAGPVIRALQAGYTYQTWMPGWRDVFSGWVSLTQGLKPSVPQHLFALNFPAIAIARPFHDLGHGVAVAF